MEYVCNIRSYDLDAREKGVTSTVQELESLLDGLLIEQEASGEV